MVGFFNLGTDLILKSVNLWIDLIGHSTARSVLAIVGISYPVALSRLVRGFFVFAKLYDREGRHFQMARTQQEARPVHADIRCRVISSTPRLL